MTQITKSQEVTVKSRMNCNDVTQAKEYVTDVLFCIRVNYEVSDFVENSADSWGFDIIIPHGLVTSVSLQKMCDEKIHVVVIESVWETKALRLCCWIDKEKVQLP